MPRLRFVSAVQGADTIELQEPVITIGRGVNNVVCIEDANISKNHVLLIREDDTYRIFDLHSVNGTTINGKRIGAATLQTGDAVRIGYLDLTYEIAAPVPAGPAVPEPPAALVVAPAVRPRLGLARPAPASITPVPAPAPVPPSQAVVPTPVLPVSAPTPLSAPVVPVAPTPAARPHLGFAKPAAAPISIPESAPVPATPVVPEPATPVVATTAEPAAVAPVEPAAPAENSPAVPPAGHKKFGAPPGGQNLKFKLKRE